MQCNLRERIRLVPRFLSDAAGSVSGEADEIRFLQSFVSLPVIQVLRFEVDWSCNTTLGSSFDGGRDASIKVLFFILTRNEWIVGSDKQCKLHLLLSLCPSGLLMDGAWNKKKTICYFCFNLDINSIGIKQFSINYSSMKIIERKLKS